MFKLNQRVKTDDGVGTIKTIRPAISILTYGILHDIFPEKYASLNVGGNILYYYANELKEEVTK